MMEKNMSELVRVLAECHAACNYCFNACLEERDIQMMTKCIKQDKECAEICILTSSLVASNSNYSKEILELCMEACETCAAECGKHHYDHCQACAKACNKCAEVCKAYA
jgi:hypothetical protein